LSFNTTGGKENFMFSQFVTEHLRNATYRVAIENPRMSGTEVYHHTLRRYSNPTEKFVGIATIRKWCVMLVHQREVRVMPVC
jgi:hypothetical protein